MAIFDHKATCKKCKESVLYTWRKCPYCGGMRFVRKSSVFDVRGCFGNSYNWIFKQHDGGSTLFCISIIWTFIAAPALSATGIGVDIKDALNEIPIIDETLLSLIILVITFMFMFFPVLIVMVYCMVHWVFTLVLVLFPYYLIHPIFHFTGKKVTIANVAKNDRCNYRRKTAVEMLTDQDILVDVAKNDMDWEVRMAAVKKLTDQDVLADVAKTDKRSDVRKAAVKKLTDQSIIVEIAQTDNDFGVKEAAFEMFDATNMHIIPEIVDEVISGSGSKYWKIPVRDFVKFAYRISQQEQKNRILQKHKAIVNWGDHSDYRDHSDYPYCTCSDYEYHVLGKCGH